MNLNSLPLSLPIILGFLGRGSVLALVASVLLSSRHEAVRRRVLELAGMADLSALERPRPPAPYSRLLTFAARCSGCTYP